MRTRRLLLRWIGMAVSLFPHLFPLMILKNFAVHFYFPTQMKRREDGCRLMLVFALLCLCRLIVQVLTVLVLKIQVLKVVQID